MQYYSADYIIPVNADPIPNGVVAVEGHTIKRVGPPNDFSSVDIQHYPGIILPGFVNAHCHLELSHMKGIPKTGTGLIPFITDVVKLRDFDQEVIDAAISEMDNLMYASGIQAVGDISNKPDTARTKSASPIAYYTFVEMFDFLQTALTETTIKNYKNVYDSQSEEGLNKKSFVPHAPYSVSKELFAFINDANPYDVSISIHNQETPDEHYLFQTGKGRFPEFYKGFGFDMKGFLPSNKVSVYYALEHMQPKARNLFVHNTLTSEEDVKAVHSWSRNTYWVSCPNANLYIENRLPHYQYFLNQDAKICLGTDSIMSNWQLDIWEEIKTIKKFQSYIDLEQAIRWATLNGAEALGYEDVFGSIEVDKTPGLVHIELQWQGDATEISRSRAVRIL